MATMIPELRATAPKTLELSIYDRIGPSGDGRGVEVKSIAEQLKAAGDVETIHVHINSEGGRVDHGLAIYNVLRDHPARVVVRIDGMAASAASIIAMAGDAIEVFPSSLLLIHNPRMQADGDAAEIRRVADVLDVWAGACINAYAERTRLPAADIKSLMDASTWLTAQEAVTKGFATKLLTSEASGARNAAASAVAIPEASGASSRRVPVRDVDRFVKTFGAEAGLHFIRAGKTFQDALAESGKRSGLAGLVRMAGEDPGPAPADTKPSGLAKLVRFAAPKA